MKLLKIPAPVKLEFSSPSGTQEQEVTFHKFLSLHLDALEPKTWAQIRTVEAIARTIEAAKGDTMAFEDAEFEVLKDAVDKPRYLMPFARKMLSFKDSVENPEEVKK